mmetsp:Transcript_12588/g.23580  ORF Transcript_12588/g.23580 Transcript_12588/m.23580 type:complete len:323 (+) Transcript_12588:43-1011(+)
MFHPPPFQRRHVIAGGVVIFIASVAFILLQVWPIDQYRSSDEILARPKPTERPRSREELCASADRVSCGTECSNAFWTDWIQRALDPTKDLHPKYARWYSERMNKSKEYEYQTVVKMVFNDDPPEQLWVMDMGAGLLTSAGYIWPGHKVHLVPIDQADLRPIVQQYNVTAPVPTLDQMSMYTLLERFPAQSFDFITVNNALTAHNNLDGVLCTLEVGMHLLKPHGAMWISDGVYGEVQFNNKKGRVFVHSISNPGEAVFLDEHLSRYAVNIKVLSPYNRKIRGIPSPAACIGFLIQKVASLSYHSAPCAMLLLLSGELLRDF